MVTGPGGFDGIATHQLPNVSHDWAHVPSPSKYKTSLYHQYYLCSFFHGVEPTRHMFRTQILSWEWDRLYLLADFLSLSWNYLLLFRLPTSDYNIPLDPPTYPVFRIGPFENTRREDGWPCLCESWSMAQWWEENFANAAARLDNATGNPRAEDAGSKIIIKIRLNSFRLSFFSYFLIYVVVGVSHLKPCILPHRYAQYHSPNLSQPNFIMVHIFRMYSRCATVKLR